MAQPAYDAPNKADAGAQPSKSDAKGSPGPVEPVAIDATAAALTADHFRPPLVHAWQDQAAAAHDEPLALGETRRRWPIGWAIVFTATASASLWAAILTLAWLLI